MQLWTLLRKTAKSKNGWQTIISNLPYKDIRTIGDYQEPWNTSSQRWKVMRRLYSYSFTV